jgi:hypothetical protein
MAKIASLNNRLLRTSQSNANSYNEKKSQGRRKRVRGGTGGGKTKIGSWLSRGVDKL